MLLVTILNVAAPSNASDVFFLPLCLTSLVNIGSLHQGSVLQRFLCAVLKSYLARRACFPHQRPVYAQPGNTKGGNYHCAVDLLFDWFGLICFANKNNNCQLSYSWFQACQTGGPWYSDTYPFRIPRHSPTFMVSLLCRASSACWPMHVGLHMPWSFVRKTSNPNQL